MHVAGLHLFTPPKDRVETFIPYLLSSWGEYIKAQPPFNLRPVLKKGLWHWEEDTEFELDYHLRHVALPRPGRIRELLSMVSRLHGTLMDRNRPLWEAYMIEGLPGGRFATYVKVHHALIDGVSGARMMAQSLSRSPSEMKPPQWAQHLLKRQPEPKTRTMETWAQPLLNAVRKGSEILPGIGSGLWELIHASQADSVSAKPFQAPPTSFNVEVSGSRRFVAQSYSLSRFKELGETMGATVNDVTLAVCAGALRRYLLSQKALPKSPLIAMVPISLHDEQSGDGNQVSLMLANLATNLADPAKRLKRIVASTQAAKKRLSSMSRLQKMAHGIAMMSTVGPSMITGSAKERPFFNLVISNVPGPRESLYLNGAHMDELYPVSIPSHYLALNITISGYRDQLGFGFVACRRSVPSLQRMIDHTDEAIAELERALLPNQTPLATLSAKTATKSKPTLAKPARPDIRPKAT